MSEETKSFKCQLEEIREQLDRCKLERVRRHSEFTRRVDDIKARHERLTSGRLRRLSFEGIIVDIDTIRSHKLDSISYRSEVRGERENCFTQYVKRDNSESVLTHIEASENHFAEKIVPDLHLRHYEEKQPSKQLRFEFAFDSKVSNTLNHKKTTKFKYENKWRNARNKSRAKHGMQDNTQNKNKFQSAFAKVLRVQKFTSQRRHSILSMAPVDIGEKSRPPSEIICDQSQSQPPRQNPYTINSPNMTDQRHGNTKK